MSRKPPTLLLDGDMFLYKAAVSNEVEVNWGNDLWTLHSDAKEAWAAMNDQIDRVCKELKSHDIIFCISDDHNFRKEVFPAYKSKRKETRKPLAYYGLKEFALKEFKYAIFPRCEADDTMGILATQKGANCIIVSDDKDMKTIPARLYRQNELTTYNEEQANYHMVLQTLTGDATDGYSGLKGFGEVKAKKLLDNTKPADWWKATVAAYVKEGFTEDDALVQARCARILRASDWNDDKKELILWTPPSL